MRAREFITEQQKLPPEISEPLRYTYVLPGLSASDPYNNYRFGVAMARARSDAGTDGINAKFPAWDSETAFGEHGVVAGMNGSIAQVIDTALTADVAASASVYVYTTKIDQPVRILSIRYADGPIYDEIPTWQVSRDEYYNQPSKTATGATNSWYYWRDLSIGKLNIWPIADNCTRVLRFSFIKPQYIPEDQSEDILIPPEWYAPLKFKLAADLGITYAIDPNKQIVLEQKAAQYLEDAMSTDNEFSSFSFYPEDRR